MPFTLDDLDRITIRVGMSDKTLRDLSDTGVATLGVPPACYVA